MVTSESRSAELTRLRQLGATRVLSKPLPLEGFCSEVTRLCDGVASPDEPEVPAVDTGKAACRAFQRFETTAPPRRPPVLHCLKCDWLLEYQKSRVGGVSSSNREQWDQLRCSGCAGTFDYRHRTKKLRHVT